MSVLNTFFILFKSNAEDVIKGNKAIEKSTKDTEKAIKNTNEEAHKLGQSFVKMVEGGAIAAGAYAGFNILKNAVLTADDYNTQLVGLARNAGITAQSLKQMAQAAAEAGGTTAGALSDIMGINAALAVSGKSIGEDGGIRKIFDQIRSDTHDKKGNLLGKGAVNSVLKAYGITDLGDINRLTTMSEKEYNSTWNDAGDVTNLTPKNAKKSLDLYKARQHATGAEGMAATELGGAVTPGVGWLAKIYDAILGKAGGSTGGALTGAAGVIGGSALAGLFTIKGLAALARGFGGRGAGGAVADAFGGTIATGGAAAGAGLGSAALVGGSALAAGTAAGYGIVSLFSKQIEGLMVKFMTRDIIPIAKRTKSGSNDLDFWTSQGYSRDQAAGIMANINAESGGKDHPVGDSGYALGIGQWHSARRAAIFKGTGIDVATASRADQLKAYAWEMKNGNTGFNDAKFRGITGADAAGAYVSQHFEMPRDKIGQAMLRGRNALALSSQFGARGGGGTTVKIDKIEVNTQATDASGIAGSLNEALNHHLNIVQANNDDGQLM